jgi:hypothetical protein
MKLTIRDYVAEHRGEVVKSDIVERWHGRMVANGWDRLGSAGAEEYLGRYGKGMKAGKCVGFARCAEDVGCAEVAVRFWEEAYWLESGKRENLGTAEKKFRGGSLKDVPALQVTAEVLGATSPMINAKVPFGHYPQLLVAVDWAEALRLARLPSYGAQEKKDGERVMVRDKGGVITAGNKKGLVRHLPLNIVAELREISSDFLIDCELIGTTLWVFDYLDAEYAGQPFLDRWYRLMEVLDGRCESIEVVPLVSELKAKLALIEDLRKSGKEGFVLKRLDAPYEAGSAHGTQWKYQFRTINACVVGKRNGVKESVEIWVYRKDGTRRSMGYVTIPANAVFPKEGEIGEIENLYCHTGKDGKFAQAVFKGVRTDAEALDCQESKLRVKEEEAA